MSKTVVITGASSGIGKEFAYIHAEKGHNLVLVARNEKRLDAIKLDIVSKYQVQVHVFSVDLTLVSSVENLKNELDSKGIQIDFLINNAGFGDFGSFSSSEWSKQQNMIQLNVVALTQLTHIFLPDLILRKGKILNVASVAAFQPGPMMSVYFASKAFVLSFSEAIAEELKIHGVTVTTLCPGPTESEFMDISGMGDSKMIKGRKLPSSRKVAEYSYRAMIKGKPVAIHGFPFQILIFSLRFIPRRWVTFFAMKMMKS